MVRLRDRIAGIEFRGTTSDQTIGGSEIIRAIPDSASEQFKLTDDFQNTQRFVVQERLGSGTFGVVYRALDRERNSIVALKKLIQFHPSHLMRFKREFRSLVGLVHPNLVQLYELFGDDREWFFTMELVEGLDFLSHVRPRNVLSGWDRLRDAFHQLVTGVQALHASARLHRDLKPSNVLITRDGRVVILDFGLVKEFESQSIEQSFAFAGTPAYMAPEQAAGGYITESVDWYAVGVMLYEAITGHLPFTGTRSEVMERKQTESAPRSKDFAPDVPADLDEACQNLLAWSPEARSNGTAVLQAAGYQNTRKASAPQDDFVGRAGELRWLHKRFSAVYSGNREVVLLHGWSGIGKTCLISHFLSEIRSEHPDAVILKGRCRESESVPYKALDPIVDEVIRYLQTLTEPAVAGLLPRHPALLRRLFPIFGDLDICSAFPNRLPSNIDDQEIRRRAFAAFCEMLGRMTDRSPVVISIDDLQWSDLDSIAFLAELILPPNAPALMLILSFRDEEADSSPPLRLLRGFQEQLKDTNCWTDIQVKGLPEDEACDLLRRLQKDGPPISEAHLRGILQDCGGSPLLLSELLRFASRELDACEKGPPAPPFLLSQMIRDRVSTLSSTARNLLEIVSVADEPLSNAALHRTLKASKASDTDPSREIRFLIQERLIRVTGGIQAGRLEPFHDVVREASLSWLSPSDLRSWHARLAKTFEAEEDSDPQRLLRHYRGAGNLPAAFQAALAAAKISENALAFEQAARFYAEALETGEANVLAQATLHRKRAEALSKAGRGHESGRCYLEAARWHTYSDALEMQRLAAEQLMRSGYLDEGTQILTALLRNVGVYMPVKPLESLLRMLALRAFIRVRGMRWRERTEAEIPADRLRKLDLLWNGALILTSVNPIFASYLQARHMLDALRAGEPFRLALSVGLGALYAAVGGVHDYHRGRKLLDFARQLAERQQSPYLTAMTLVYWATLDQWCGHIEDGLEHCRRAATSLAEIGIGVAWETVTVNMLLIWFLGWGGRIRELSEKVPRILDDGRSRGDVYADVTIRCFTTAHLLDLAADNPERAITETAHALSHWRKTRHDIQHFGATFAYVECHLYAGRCQQARRIALAEWSALMSSLIFRKSQLFRIMLFYMRARTALAEWLEQRAEGELRGEIEAYASRLANIRSPWGNALGDLLRAGVLVGCNRLGDAVILLERAEDTLRKQDLRLLAAAVSRRRGELEDKSGYVRMEAADAFMRSENILRPDRMTAMILPGNWRSPSIAPESHL